MNKINAMLVLLLGWGLMGCGGHKFGLALEDDSFSQNSKVTSVPIDILWVIDNSGSMETSQNQVANNIEGFINKFKDTNFDFRIAVTTTGAYQSLALFGGADSLSRFKDGTDATSHTGVFVIDRDTPDIVNVFKTNVKQGITGSADERGLQSLQATLLNSQNAVDFPRAGAFLAVIYLTDEEDFSWNGTANIQLLGDGTPNSVTDPRLLPTSDYLSFLDGITASTADKRNYSVNTIAIFSEACRQQLSTSFSGRRITTRYAEMSDATGGVKANLCDDFSGVLSNISDSILELSTRFTLSREPDPTTIEIYVDDALVPAEGWTYNPEDISVTFHSPYIPSKDANIRVKFQPVTVR
jgi:hypothetical protein